MKYATIEIKERAVYLYLFEGCTYEELGKIFNYSAVTIKTWVSSYKNGELWLSKKRGCPPRRLDEEDFCFIKKQLDSTNHTSVREMARLLGEKCGKSTIHKALHDMGLTFKKNSARGRKKQA